MNDPTHPVAGYCHETAVSGDSRQQRQHARRRLICEAVARAGALRIDEITGRFGISLMTAHRDIDELAVQGLVRKARGLVCALGAPPVAEAPPNGAAKQAIARAALARIASGQAVFLDDSETVSQLAPLLATKTPLRVTTNALSVMGVLGPMADVQLIGIGGLYNP